MQRETSEDAELTTFEHDMKTFSDGDTSAIPVNVVVLIDIENTYDDSFTGCGVMAIRQC